jgi:hypothetical protein
MDKVEKDRQLLENLDRILKGRESEIKEPMDDDAQTALGFARKMASLREKPSQEFRANLKAQLIHQLAEQEKKERSRNQSLLFWEIPHSRRWQGTIAALIALIILAIILLITYLLNRAG